MPRKHRAACEGLPHHITARGTDKRVVFHDDVDRQRYLSILFEAAEGSQVEIWGYCLMPNHVHIVAVPAERKSLSACFKRAHGRYSTYFHLRHNGCGHLWQCRFFSCALGGASVWRALAYVELNAVRAGLVGRAVEYPWCSAAFHCGLSKPGFELSVQPWRTDWTSTAWSELLDSHERDEVFDRYLEDCTRTGHPIGDAEFVAELERRLGRRLRPGKAGRPPKAKAPVAEFGNMVSVPDCLEAEIPGFVGLHELVPGDGPSRVRRCAA